MKAVKTLTIMAVLAVMGNPDFAVWRYAGHDGSNRNAYTTRAAAAQVIQDAIIAKDRRDSAFLGAGTWSQPVKVWADNKALICIILQGGDMEELSIWLG